MDFRSQGASRKLSLYPTPHSNVDAGSSRILPSTRPLSDIREITEPSLYEPVHRKPVSEIAPARRPSKAGIAKRNPARPASKQSQRSPIQSPQFFDDRSSVYSIPLGSVPPRSSSHNREKRSVSIPRAPAVLLPPPKPQYHCITNNGQGQSPVKDAFENDPDYAKRGRVPSKTIIKPSSQTTNDVLSHPTHLHPRIKLDILLVAPLFVGGSSVEGTVRIIVDEADRARHRKTLTLERLSIDLLGIEEVSGNRKNVFLALANELVDLDHPPPPDMVESHTAIGPKERSWILLPSVSTLPFLLRLPLEVGPPPFRSKHASIRYTLCATLTFKDGGRQLCVRCSQDTAILSVYDPEKALVSLPSPLTVHETYELPRARGQECVEVTAGLHRQVWVSGTTIFADVHIINNSHKTIKKMELQLERRVLCYRHAAASTLEMSASQARIFDQDERLIAGKTVIKAGAHGWNGVLPYTTVLRTCDLELPRGHATIKCNKYFEVRYFLNVIVGTSHLKSVSIQLPIILIHMNSLDVPTNSVAQVAAAIAEKRAGATHTTSTPPRGSPRLRRKPSVAKHPTAAPATAHLQGRAFNAPRMQSLERARRQQQEDIAELGRLLDASPRKKSMQRREEEEREREREQWKGVRRVRSGFGFKTPPSNRKGRILTGEVAEEVRRRLGGSQAGQGRGHVRAGSYAESREGSVLGKRNAGSASGRGLGGGAGMNSRESSALGWSRVDGGGGEDGEEGAGVPVANNDGVGAGNGNGEVQHKIYAASSKASSLAGKGSFEAGRRLRFGGRLGWFGGGGG